MNTRRKDKGKVIKKILLLVGISFLLTWNISMVTANAEGINLKALPSDIGRLIKIDAYYLTHPANTYKIVEGINSGNSEVVKQYFEDPEDVEFINKIQKLPSTVGQIEKVALITANPKNSEKNVVPIAVIPSSHNFDRNLIIEQSKKQKRNYSFLAIQNYTGNSVNLDIFFAYKDQKNNLVVLGILKNNTNSKVTIKGIHQIDLKAEEKVLAQGLPDAFKEPIKLAPYKQQINDGVYDGLPTQCFVKIVFEPGTYDDSIDISKLDYLGSAYSLDYSVLD